ncbi:hypothetical protein Sru01_47770 [Sphaerisporangium rufum]|uniref:DUF5666 domain-containing protein n=1 Tax=Sphaerisporangium rufum TaxID=1381558 RepID=A0A919R7T0_9ACTN|nr:DUF5666 domain-containing protein [Sphaerisporangium rufum]GII79795.1 hypothetical protein Sru01_47770 [Sphaerisporangium rufum]
MRISSRALVTGAVAGALTVGALGGVAVARQSGPSAAVPYELLSAAESGDVLSAGADKPGDRAGLRIPLRRGLVGVHGEATVRTRGGGFAAHAWQRGAVTAASATSVTVKSADGLSWTWTVNADTKIRKNGAKSTSAAVATGDKVFVVGRLGGETRTAQLVVVPKRTKE